MPTNSTSLRLLRSVLPLAVAMSAALAGCGSATQTTDADPVGLVTVTPGVVNLEAGDTVRLDASAFDGNGSAVPGASFQWSSDDEAVATVSSGLVTAVGEGTATIEAMVDGVVGGATVNVSAPSAARTVYFTETFESANANNRGWFDGSSGNWTLSMVEFHSGSRALEWHWDVGEVLPAFGGTSRRMFPASESVHISFWVKYSSSWMGSGQPYHPHEFYLLTNLDSEWIGPSRTHLTAYVEHNYQMGLRPAVGIQDALNINESNAIPSNLTSVTENRSVAGCNGSGDGYPGDCYGSPGSYNNGKFWYAGAYLNNTPGPTDKNGWHFVEAYLELNSIANGVGQTDGIIRYWVDGNLLIDVDDALLRTGAHSTMAFRTLLLGPYIGPGSPVDQTVWIDDLTVANRR